MKFKEFGVKIETKCTNLMMEDICMKTEKYRLIDSYVRPLGQNWFFYKSGQKLNFL